MAKDIKKMMEDYILAWHSHDVNKIVSFFTDDCIFEDVALETAHRGKKEVTAFVSMLLIDFPDINFELKSVFGAGDWACMEWVWSGTHTHSSVPTIPVTGKTFSVREACVFQLRDGKFSRQSDYCNMTTFLEQVGLGYKLGKAKF